MPRWTIQEISPIPNPTAGGYDSDRAWTFTCRNEETQQTHETRVDISTPRIGSELPEASQRAIETEGRSAMEAYLDDERLPDRVVVNELGVFPESPAERSRSL